LDDIHLINFFHLVTVKSKPERKKIKNVDYCVALGAHIRKLREQRGYSLRGFATMMDVEYNLVYRVEHGKTNTSVSMIQAIAETLGVHPKELLDFKFPTSGKKK
jgi:predicted transcriptional regulator